MIRDGDFKIVWETTKPPTFTALHDLVDENYGERTTNISADSIYTGALGAALFAQRGHQQAA